MTEASRHGYVTAAAEREVVSSDVVLLLGRVLMAAIFLNGGFHKLTGLEGFAGYLAGHGVPVGAYPIAVLAACVEFFGALSGDYKLLVIHGDYFDVIRLSATKLGICIADVVGKSVSAALLMANVQASVRAFASEVIGRVKLDRMRSGLEEAVTALLSEAERVGGAS